MDSKWEESLGLVNRKDFFEEKQLVTLRAQHQMGDCAQHVNLQRLMPRTDVHWACRSSQSKKTLRDWRARRLEIALKSTEHLEVMEEETAQTAVSIRDTDSKQDSKEDRPVTAGQHVSLSAPTPTYKKTLKALGTPLPEGHGSTRQKTVFDGPSGLVPKKAAPPPTSESNKSVKSSTSHSSKRPHSLESKLRCPASELKQLTPFSGLKKIQTLEPKKAS
ncbi:hypothetical protein NDU88_003365 [Pleurodeles waltl]|uniref:Uncharacterized protein n=1 Tax=Pleurodeles waltl TaxID=8319 RepID=A0AAV7PGP6_PLEWA|nr:hypothetical protein NDU88_003365 [Pleurodeles waltl]